MEHITDQWVRYTKNMPPALDPSARIIADLYDYWRISKIPSPKPNETLTTPKQEKGLDVTLFFNTNKDNPVFDHKEYISLVVPIFQEHNVFDFDIHLGSIFEQEKNTILSEGMYFNELYSIINYILEDAQKDVDITQQYTLHQLSFLYSQIIEDKEDMAPFYPKIESLKQNMDFRYKSSDGGNENHLFTNKNDLTQANFQSIHYDSKPHYHYTISCHDQQSNIYDLLLPKENISNLTLSFKRNNSMRLVNPTAVPN